MNKLELEQLINKYEKDKEEKKDNVYALCSSGEIKSYKGDYAAYYGAFPRKQKDYLTESEIINKYGSDMSRKVVVRILNDIKNGIINHYENDDDKKYAYSCVFLDTFASYKTAEELDFLTPVATKNKNKVYEPNVSDLLLVKYDDKKVIVSYEKLKQELKEVGFEMPCTKEELFKQQGHIEIKLDLPSHIRYKDDELNKTLGRRKSLSL